MLRLILTSLLGFCLIFSISVRANYLVEVIETQRSAKTLLQQLDPLFQNQAIMTAKDHQLIIKSSPTTIEAIKSVLKKIDKINFLQIKLKLTEKTNVLKKKKEGFYKNFSSHNSQAEKLVYLLQTTGLDEEWISIKRQQTKLHNSVLSNLNIKDYQANNTNISSFKNMDNHIEQSQSALKNEQNWNIFIHLMEQNQLLLKLNNNAYQELSENQNKPAQYSQQTIVKGVLGEWIDVLQVHVPNKNNTLERVKTYYIQINNQGIENVKKQ